MKENLQDALRNEFHNINNLLNKISTSAGMAKYRLERDGISPEELEEERMRLVKLLADIEENIMKISEVLKRVKKEII